MTGEGSVRVDDCPDMGAATGGDDPRSRLSLVDRVLGTACSHKASATDDRRQGDHRPDA